jgi:LemA protein
MRVDWPVIAALAVVVVLVIAFIAIRNGIIVARIRVDEGWSGIDVQLKRRHDLIPNLVATVKGYAAHERRVLEEVTEARAEAVQATGVQATEAAERRLSSALVNLRGVAEAYPALRATENFQHLQADLTDTEDQIQGARRIYNANVRAYNTKVQVFPSSIVAASGGFEPREFFEVDSVTERELVRVSFE